MNDAPTGGVTIDNTTPQPGRHAHCGHPGLPVRTARTISGHRNVASMAMVVGSGATMADRGRGRQGDDASTASYTDGHGTDVEVVTSTQTAAVANVNDALTGGVTIDNATPSQATRSRRATPPG